MRFQLKFVLTVLVFFSFLTGKAQRQETCFNKGWKFLLEDNSAFSSADYDDSTWTGLDIPHDWAFENGIHKDGAQGQGGGYHDGGIGWYRKSFQIKRE